MKPGTDTRQRVLEVADQLLAQGRRPTQQNVRELLGSGSLTTINKALNEWWQGLAERVSRRNEHPELPEAVLVSAGKLWDQALAYAEHAYAERHQSLERDFREQLDQAQTDAQARLTDQRQLQQQNARLLDRSEQLSDQLDAAQAERIRLEERVIRLVSDNEAQARQLKQQALLLDRQSDSNHPEQLLETRVRLRIQEEEVKRLQASNDRLAEENARLRQQLQEQERSALQRVHQLELELARKESRLEELLR